MEQGITAVTHTLYTHSPLGGEKNEKKDLLGTVLVTVLDWPFPEGRTRHTHTLSPNQRTFMLLSLLDSPDGNVLAFTPVYFTPVCVCGSPSDKCA